MLKLLIVLLILALTVINAQITHKTVEYKDGDYALEGYVSYNKAFKNKLPGILVVHEWTGINDYVKKRCDDLAKLGYVAFAADIYGKGVRPVTIEDAGKTSLIYKNDRQLMRKRINAALNELKKLKNVNPNKIAAMGYCFGGGVALELARSGAQILGTVSFHGNLDTPDPDDAKNIKGKILILHGSDDMAVPLQDVLKFVDEMRNAGVNYEIDLYGGTVHSFTNPASGNDPQKGIAYNELADKRSWDKMVGFFIEIFK